ncbi:MAG: phytanoyl-CoA dioxygenase family protein [Lutibacter sp.]|nr:phytanoyl-CoA dioxygenase family protein [Lutibacter sp.]
MDGNWKDKNDVRFFGAQYFDSSVYSFYSNLKLYQSFKDLGISIPLRNETTLMGNLTFEKDVFNGSGGGWHIDSWGFQPKAMTYLTDVSPDNGPFQYIEGSQKFVVQLFIFINARLRKGTRIDENLVQKVLKWFPSCKLIEFTGQKGSILLFDPRGIHRGKPILEGKRIALTNYYVPNFLTTTSIGKLDLKIKNSVKK